MNSRAFVTTLLLPTLLICRMPCAPAAESLESLRTNIEKMRVESGVASIAVAVSRHGRIVWEGGFGWANREKRIPATQHTLYSLASISKPITATALMTLVEAGRIDLDAPINNYLGDAKLQARVGNASDATVRRVANHSAGLPEHYQFFFADESNRPPSRDETILRYGNLITAPGEHFEYSNLGYGVLDYVIARTSGQTYDDFMRQEVFVKLGLTHTSVGIGPGLEPYEAIRYDDDTGAPIPPYDFDHPGASAVYSSAHDLVRFGMFHLKDHLADQRAILTDASIDEMHRATVAAEGDLAGSGYGVGWFSRDRADGYRVVSHSGGMPGVATILDLVPAEDIAVVVLSNGGGRVPGAVRDAIMKKLLPRWQIPTKSARQSLPHFNPPQSLLGVWNGLLHTYSADIPLVLEFLPGGDVHLRVGEQLALLLNEVQFQDGWLRGTVPGDIPTPDLDRHRPYELKIQLKLRGNTLNGGVTATNNSARPFALTQWAQLSKRQPQALVSKGSLVDRMAARCPAGRLAVHSRGQELQNPYPRLLELR